MSMAATEPILALWEWDPKAKKDVDTMTRVFASERRKGRRFFAVLANGSPGKQIEEFDASLGKMILKPKPTVWDRIREAS